MDLVMLDLDLLRSFVSVVDAGGFTRASQRVHRTQAAVSQQIKRLEQALGCPLFVRDGGGGRRVAPTEAGERLLAYARRILALTEEARQVVGQPGESVIRLGIPEDFAAARLTDVLARSMRASPKLRLDVRCDLSVNLRNDLDRGDLDLILFKRDTGERGGLAA
jgi:DNA-binding transcriptional LysR family regulator